jgi:hypothetical protein
MVFVRVALLIKRWYSAEDSQLIPPSNLIRFIRRNSYGSVRLGAG